MNLMLVLNPGNQIATKVILGGYCLLVAVEICLELLHCRRQLL